MKPLLVIIPLICFACNHVSDQGLPDAGFTNKEEAKNQMVNGLKEGKWVEFIDKNGSVVSDTNALFFRLIVYNHGKAFGIVREYYKKEGTLESETAYSDGKKNGLSKHYYKSSELMIELPYSDDTVNGVVKRYYKSGKLMSEDMDIYTNGTKTGLVKEYYENGNVKYYVPLNRSNNADGIEKGYYENGQLRFESQFVNGHLNGLSQDYYADGKLKSVTNYADDTALKRKNYDENGNEIK